MIKWINQAIETDTHTQKRTLQFIYLGNQTNEKENCKGVSICRPFFCLLFRFISVNKYLRNPTKINTDIVLFQSHAFLLCLFSVFRSLLFRLILITWGTSFYTANTVWLCVFEDVSVSRKTVFINRNCFNFSYLS